MRGEVRRGRMPSAAWVTALGAVLAVSPTKQARRGPARPFPPSAAACAFHKTSLWRRPECRSPCAARGTPSSGQSLGREVLATGHSRLLQEEF